MSSLGANLDIQSNVRVIVYNKEHRIKQQIEKHNKAGVALIQGILKFLRGEFNPSNISNELIAHNVNGAKIYIPAYVNFGCGGLSISGSGSSKVITNNVQPTSYYDTMLQRELVDIEHDFNRLPISKSELGTSASADNGILNLVTYIPAGHYTNMPGSPAVSDDVAYLTEVALYSNIFNGYKSNLGKMLARVTFDEEPIQQTEEDIILVQWNLGVISIDDKYWVQDKGNFGTNWV
jgi:hypothetical protein